MPALILLVLLGSLGLPSHATAATLIVLNKAEATVSLIDPDSGAIRATLPTAAGPHEVAVSADGRQALIANYGQREAGNSLTLIDIVEARVIRQIDLGDYRRPHGIVWPKPELALVTAEANQALLKLALPEATLTAIATEQEVSHMLALRPDGRRAFVANIGSGSVSVIDLQHNRLLRSIGTGAGAEGIAVSPDGAEVWVSNRAANSLSVLDAETLALRATIACGDFPIRLQFTPDGSRVLVSNAKSAELAVFDAKARREIARLRFPDAAADDQDGRLFGQGFASGSVPIGILVEPNGRRAFVAHAHADKVSVIDLRQLAVVGELRAGKEPDGLGWSPF